MKDHDKITSILKEKELIHKISPKNNELNEIMEQADNPKIMMAVMYRLIEEKERTNKLLESMNEKYDQIMLHLKTQNSPKNLVREETNQMRFEVLAEQDQLILKIAEEKGGISSTEVKELLNYKGLNAACQRLNKLYREGNMKKVQSGRKVLYLAKS